MKPLFLVFAFLGLASQAFADFQTGDIRQYKIDKFDFSTYHAKNPVSGAITVDSVAQTVKMEIQQAMPSCPAGMACIQVMPMPIEVELPIKKIEKDSCGVLHILAYQDLRPVDGLLEEIRIEDASELTCQTLVPVYSNATYRTVLVSRMTGKASETKSQMILERLADLSTKTQSFQFQEGQFLVGFPQIEVPHSGRLELGEKNLTLEVYINLNCGMGPCPAYMPHPIQVTLPIVKRTKGFCGDVIVAEETVRTHFGLSTTTVEVTDYRTAACEIYIKHPIRVNFSVKDIIPGGTHEKAGVLYFN